MKRPKRPRLDPTEHPRPQVMVPMSIFGDLLFRNDYALVGEFVHWWCHAVWKKDPTFHTAGWADGILERAIGSGFVVADKRSRTGYRHTGPSKDPRWLLDKRRRWSTYIVEAVDQNIVKIGKSTDVERRFDELQVACPHDLRLLVVIDGDHEQTLHRRFSLHRVNGEWFAKTDEIRVYLASLETS